MLSAPSERRIPSRGGLPAVFGLVALAVAAFASPGYAQAPGPAAGAAQPPAKSSIIPSFLAGSTEFGFAVFQARCTACHGNSAVERAPTPAALREYSAERIYTALTTGVMKTVGDTLTDEERRMVSQSLSGKLLGSAQNADAKSMGNLCKANPPMRNPAVGPGWNGWGADLQNTRHQSAAQAGLTAADVPKLKLKYAIGLPNSTSSYSQPTVVGGRLFVGADTGYIYAFNADTGCVYWSFLAKAGVRNAMMVGPIKAKGAGPYAVYFGDLKSNVYALDARTGKQIWTMKVDQNYTTRVTASPSLHAGRLYVPVSSWEEFSASSLDYGCCTSQGAVAALNANTGKLIWKTYVMPDRPVPTRKNSRGVQQYGPAGGSVWNTPTLDLKRNALYVGTGDATTTPPSPTSDSVLAMDMTTGKVLWSYQAFQGDSFLGGCAGPTRTDNCPQVQGPDWDIPSSVALRDLPGGKRVLVVGTKPGDIIGLDPDNKGAQLWRTNVRGGAIIGDKAVASPGMPSGGVLWGFATDETNAYMGLTRGGMAAMKLATGERAWLSPLNNAEGKPGVSYGSAGSSIPGVIFQGGSDGKILAISADKGEILWSAETKQAFTTVNKTPGKGGSISSAGPVVAGGMLFVPSGYSVLGGQPGNVVLAYSPK